jgi:uncharacterized OB-fold protein
MQAPNRPVPIPTNVTREYWDYVNNGQLRLPYCLDCNGFTYYPRPLCMRCMSRNLEYRPVSGQGTL